LRASWSDDAAARELIARAARVGVTPPPGARARVWNRLQEERLRARVTPRRRWPLFTVAAGALTAALVLGLLRLMSPSSTVLVLAADGANFEVQAGQALPALAEPSLVDLPAVGRMVVGAGTQATLEQFNSRDVSITLQRGSLLAHVTPRSKRAPVLIHTATFTARVVGTVLRVVAHGDGRASIAVGHGAVLVQPKSGAPAVMIHAGERWPADSRDVPSGDELQRLGAADLEGVGSDAFLPKPAQPAAMPLGSPSEALPDCKALHGEGAVTCWLQLGDDASDPVRAESALYQAGWIRMHELHDAAFALGIWERQRQRYAHGVLREEVQTSIIDALVALRRSRAAEAEISDYLRAHPHGLRSAEMHFVRGTLLRAEDKNCRRARRELDVALEHPSAPWAERARAARISCNK
jgi:hypothetical protein